MDINKQAEDFLAQKRIAVVGVSRTRGTGNAIFAGLRARGYEVYPVNPHAGKVEGQTCYPNLNAIPGGVDAAVIVTRPEAAEGVVHQCRQAGVAHVWMHHNALFGKKNSSVSDAAVKYCREHNINVIPGGCPLMFGKGADIGHKCMKWILSATGGLPKVESNTANTTTGNSHA